MGRGQKYQPEQVVHLLRQIEVAVANGKTTALAWKEAGLVEQTYSCWRKEYGGLHAGDRSACQPVRTLWLSPDHGVAQASRLAGRQGPRGGYLASRGAEGSTKSRSHEAGCGSTMDRACG